MNQSLHSIYNAYVSFHPTFDVFYLSLCSNRWFFLNNHRLFNENAIKFRNHSSYNIWQMENCFHNWNRIVSKLLIVHAVYLLV